MQQQQHAGPAERNDQELLIQVTHTSQPAGRTDEQVQRAASM
jgi:hypothetical protein